MYVSALKMIDNLVKIGNCISGHAVIYFSI